MLYLELSSYSLASLMPSQTASIKEEILNDNRTNIK